MKSNDYHKVRNESWTNLGRKGGKKGRWAKGFLRRKWSNWLEKQDYKEDRKFNEDGVDNEEESC